MFFFINFNFQIFLEVFMITTRILKVIIFVKIFTFYKKNNK